MVDASSAAKIDAAVDLVDARRRAATGARGAARYATPRVLWSLVHWSQRRRCPRGGARSAGRRPSDSCLSPRPSRPWRAAPDAVLVPGAHLCPRTAEMASSRARRWRDGSRTQAVVDEPVRLAPPVASSSLDLLFDRGAVGGRSVRSLVVDGAVALVGETRACGRHPSTRATTTTLRTRPASRRCSARDAGPFRAAARRDLAKLRSATDVAPATTSRRARPRSGISV